MARQRPAASENAHERRSPAHRTDAQIAELLRTAQVIAVVGLSSKKWRASYGVSEFLQSSGTASSR